MTRISDDLDVKQFLIDSTSGQAGGILRYKPGDSLVHRLNPVTKIVIATGFIILAWTFPEFWGPLALLTVLFVGIVASGMFRTVLPVIIVGGAPIGLFLLVIHGLFNPSNETPLYTLAAVPFTGGTPIPVVGEVTVYEEGIDFALLFFFRIMVLLAALLLAIVSTHPRELVVALNEKGMPEKLSYVFLAALQLIPQMRSDVTTILETQQSRGLDTKANVIKRLKAFFALMKPLVISALIAAETRSLALESRGFGRRTPSTSIFEIEDTPLDRALRWGTVVVTVAGILWVVVR